MHIQVEILGMVAKSCFSIGTSKTPPLDPPLNLVRYGGTVHGTVGTVGTVGKRTKRTLLSVPTVPTVPYHMYQPYRTKKTKPTSRTYQTCLDLT